MRSHERSLRFNLMRKGNPISAVCTTCGKEFVSDEPRADDAILKIKAEFKEHTCKNAQAGKSNAGGQSRWIC